VNSTNRDRYFIKRALNLAAKAKGMTSPNPMVGAIIVKNGKIIAEDYHKKAGEPHAEALAILKAKDKAKDSTLYVTLEPCCHFDKRTPPCTKAIIEARIKKVLVAMRDPNPKVSGKGIMELRNNGIDVIEGIYESEAKKLNEVYIKHITTGMPFVILKAAITMDGKIATPDGQSKWITGEKSRKIVHEMRNSVDAILTAVGTVKVDNPEFTVRLSLITKKGELRNPKRIIIDPDLSTPLEYKIFNIPPETIVVTRSQESNVMNEESRVKIQKIKTLINKGIKIIQYDGERVNLNWLMKKLSEIGITSVMIEGGSSLNAYALADGIVDKLVFFIAPKIIGGKDSIPVVGGNFYRRLEEAYRLRDVSVRKIGEDLMLEGYLQTSL
jgi:diaminohydroxyphosphoribosylaminopyrimidine deaminase/5-amino-6-(5-phosphoribosylamino)uracil reductase